MRGRWNGGYVGPWQTPSAGSARGIFNAAEMQQLSGAGLWPQPANDPYFQYVTALLQGNGGPPTSVSGTNTTNFNADASTNNFQLNLNGDVRNDEFHPYQQGFYSNFFDGTGDYLTTPTDAAFDFWAGNFTFECWFYPTGNLNNSVLFSTGSNTTGVQIYFGNNIGIYTNQGGGSFLISGTAPPLNAWAHIALTKSGSTFALFLNGVRVGTSTSTAYPTGNQSAFIGANSANNGQVVAGYISNARLVKGTAVYNPNVATLTVPTSPLTAIANTSLLTCQSNRIIDNGRGATITRNGDVSVQFFQPFGLSAISTSTFTNNQPSPGTNGYYGVHFDGTGDYLDVTNNAVLNLAGSSYTIECWIYPTTTGTERRFLNKNGSGTFGYLFYLDASNTVMYRTDNTNMSGGTLTAPINNWTHVAVTNDGTTTRIFVNGVLSTSATGVTISNENVNLRIGARLFDASGAFTGFISNVRILKGTALYTSNFTPSTTPLTAIANTSLLTCQSSSILDNSGNNLTVTTAGNAAVTVAQPFTGTVAGSTVFTYGSAYFDGTGDSLVIPSSTAFQFGTADFTIETWIYLTSYSQFAMIFENGGANGGDTSGFSFGATPTNGFLYLYTNGTTVLTGNTAVPLNTWCHVAVVRSSGVHTLYLNGVSTGTMSTVYNYTGTGVSGQGVLIGRNAASTVYFTGYMSNYRVVKGTAIYTAPFIPPNMPVTAVSNTQLLSLQYNGGASNSGFEDTGPFDLLVNRAGNVSQGTFTPYGTNWSNYFDGAGDSLTYTGGSSINFGTGDFTIEAWVNLTNTGTFSAFLRPDDSGTFPEWGYDFSNNTLVFQARNAALMATSVAMPANQWVHVAVSRSGTNLRQFLNGTQVGTLTNSTNFALTTGTIRVGGSSFSSAHSVNGYMSNFRVVSGTAVYTSNFIPSTAPLTAITNTTLLTCQSNRLIDTSSNNFTISRTGDVSVQRFSPFRPTVAYNSATYGGSAYFDGTGDYLFNTTQSNAGFNMSSGSWTVEAWVYKTSSAAGTILNLTNNGTTAPGLHFWINSSNQLVQDNGAAATTAAGTVLLNTWAHVAAVCNGTNTQLYINGTPVGSVITQLPNAAQYFFVGAYAPGSTPFPGYISDVRVVKGTAIYTGAFTPPTAPLAPTANTSLLLGMANTGQYDNSMIAYWESANNTQSTRSQYKYGTGSLYFDGTADYLTTRYTQGQWFLSNTFTIEAWVYIIARATSDCPIFSQDVAVTGSFAFQALTILDNGTLNFNVRPTTGGGVTSVGGGTVPVGTWTHCAVSVDAGQARVFLNGTQVGSTTAVTMMAATLPVFVGVAGYGNGYNTGVANSNHLNGYIDDLRVTRGIARYTANFTPPTSQFVNT